MVFLFSFFCQSNFPCFSSQLSRAYVRVPCFIPLREGRKFTVRGSVFYLLSPPPSSPLNDARARTRPRYSKNSTRQCAAEAEKRKSLSLPHSPPLSLSLCQSVCLSLSARAFVSLVSCVDARGQTVKKGRKRNIKVDQRGRRVGKEKKTEARDENGGERTEGEGSGGVR